MSAGNYGHLVVAVLDENFRRHGRHTPETLTDQAAYVQWRVGEIKDGRGVESTPKRRDEAGNNDAWTRY